MIETFGLVSTVVQGYKWLQVWHEKQANPPHLPVNAILAFQRFNLINKITAIALQDRQLN
ncbi:MAG: hypothetical protein VKJ02_02835 [Snowella sp.]|nr:hypothetical protein [Snowella sp.]